MSDHIWAAADQSSVSSRSRAQKHRRCLVDDDYFNLTTAFTQTICRKHVAIYRDFQGKLLTRYIPSIYEFKPFKLRHAMSRKQG